jgi:hypothetical protein
MLSLDELLEEMEADSKIDRTNLEAEILRCPVLFSNWLKYHYDYKAAGIRGESLLADMVVKKQLFYSGAAESSEYRGHPMGHISAKNATEMGRLIDGDKDLCALREQADICNARKEICEHMIESLKFRPNHLKTVLDVRRFESGE